MSSFHGADVAELRDLAADLGTRASDLRTIESRLTARINGVRWDGPDAARFVGNWNTGHRKALVAATALFDGVARDLRTNADQQERASAAHGGSTRGGSAGGGSHVEVDRRSGPHYVELAVRGTDGPVDYSLLAGAGAQAHSNANAVVSAAGVAGSAAAMARAGVWVDSHLGYTNGPLKAQQNVSGFAGALAQAGASGRIGLDGVDLHAQAEATEGVRVKVDESIAAGPVGVSATGGGFAGGTVSADVTNHVGRDGIAEKFKADAFVGARTDGGITGDVLGVKSTARASAMAGIGANASGDLSMTYNEVHLGFGAGASLGLGAGVSYDVSFSPRELVNGIQDVGGDVAKGVVRFVKSPWPFH
jgi:hypothetical protein